MSTPKWIEFIEVPSPYKTKIFEVLSKRNGGRLGHVMWFSRWRQYSFYPDNGMVFDRTCLTDIIAFVQELMDERKRT